ncbi:ankyrin repeat-containing domain protein [Aspergillus undulatus]|uniref:ankyrin repeat-containing domain protein n=1 Tax=Aspergillus undulatus TaxID=1810928 RepID=UPI003CCCDBE7
MLGFGSMSTPFKAYIVSWAEKDRAIAQTLVNEGLDIHTTEFLAGATLLYKACLPNSLSLVRFLPDNGIDIEERNNGRLMSPLCAAICGIQNNDPHGYDVSRFILQQGAQVNTPGTGNGTYPIHVAINKAEPEALRILLEFGADIELVGRTLGALDALEPSSSMFLDSDKRYEVATIALETGASIAVNSDKAMDILKRSTSSEHSGYVRCLLSEWQSQHPGGLPASLMFSALAAILDMPSMQEMSQRGEVSIAEWRDADIYKDIWPPLTAAVRSKDEAAIEMLVALGETSDVPGPATGLTALHLALLDGSERIVRLLLPRSNIINDQNAMENTPSGYCRSNPVCWRALVVLRPNQRGYDS